MNESLECLDSNQVHLGEQNSPNSYSVMDEISVKNALLEEI